jgi:hypothetical protein
VLGQPADVHVERCRRLRRQHERHQRDKGCDLAQRAEGGDALRANKAREDLPGFGVRGRSPGR